MGNNRWNSFRAAYRETDLWVAVDRDHWSGDAQRLVMDRIMFYRSVIENHIAVHPQFSESLIPVPAPAGIHPILRDMYAASESAGTGPMSAVAGAIAEFISNDLIESIEAREVIVENGGDIFMKVTEPASVAVFAGPSPLSEKISVKVMPGDSPVSLCCSSGTTGHSLSFGKADACMVACRNGALADAYATAFCNMVKSGRMIGKITNRAVEIPAIMSVVIITGEKVGLGGSLRIEF